LFSIDNFALDSLFSDVIAVEKYCEVTISVGMRAVNMKRFLIKKLLDGIGCATTYGNSLLKRSRPQ